MNTYKYTHTPLYMGIYKSPVRSVRLYVAVHNSKLKRFVKFSCIRYDKIVINYLLLRNSHLTIGHSHQTRRGKLNCSQDYLMQPKFQDKIVQAKKIQVLDSAIVLPSPKFSCPVHMYENIYKKLKVRSLKNCHSK